MATYHPELMVDCRCELGEGPVWHDGKVWWLDILGKKIHSFDPISTKCEEFMTPCMVTAVVPAEKGGFIAATEFGIARLEGGDLALSQVSKSISADMRFNDGKCDPRGRFLAGTMHRKAESKRGALFSINEDFSLRSLVDGVTISNGLAWTADGTTLYYIDSRERRVDALDYDLETGAVKNRRPAIVLPKDQPGVPDGMSIDAEGKLWVAVWGGACILHCDPKRETILEKIELPVSQPSSCCFGGTNLDELYITSAREGMKTEQLEKEPIAGSLFRVKLPFKGLPVSKFR